MWTAEQEAALEQEHARIGGSEEHWPSPFPQPAPEEFLAMLRRVPDGAGLPGYLAVLKERAGRKS